ncbi:MAG: hypothetical protein KJ619_01295 [Candidatus Omnitrophica bacterium]|nr:hypothetical protein [Candidatus Omnitrophota bacterium]
MENNIKKQIEDLENEIQSNPINQIGKDRDLLKSEAKLKVLDAKINLELAKEIHFASGEIAVFKEAICGIAGKMNESSNKMLRASIFYFVGSLILTGLVAFAALTQANIIKINKKIKNNPIAIPSIVSNSSSSETP